MNKSHDKVKTLDELSKLIPELKKQGKKVVQCHGVFDLVHLGHIRHLNAAKEFGDILVVTTTADKFVRRGPGRPIFNQSLRSETLANLVNTDYVCVVPFPTAVEAIRAIQPDFYVKGSDYVNKEKDITQKIFDEEEAINSVGGKIVFTDEITFSSSQLINLYLDSYPQHVTQYLKQLSSRYSAEEITEMLQKVKNMKILVIGDTIIDQYHFCSPLGRSAKENIVANRYVSEEDFAGGVLATANHVAQLSENVELFTVLGAKNSFEDFIKNRLDQKIKATFLSRNDCVTTVKRRYVSEEGNKKLFEIVYLDDHPLGGEDEQKVIQFLNNNLSKYELVVVNDFGHGMITKPIMEVLCKNAKCLALNVQTNSANIGFNLVTKYLRADFVCIDEAEMRLATRDKTSDLSVLVKKIASFLDCKQIVVTRGSRGSLNYSEELGFGETPAFAQQGIDKVGAGDAFFAYTSPCFALGMHQDLIGFIGNAVGSLKLQILGNREPVKFVDLVKFITRLIKM